MLKWATAASPQCVRSRLLSILCGGLPPERVRLPALGETKQPRARGYAIVAQAPDRRERATAGLAPDGRDRAILVRRRDPVERLDRGRITAMWSEHKLTFAEGVVGFDSAVDVLIWRDATIIHSLAAFEALFFPFTVRADAAEKVARDIDARIGIRNVDQLVDVARKDSIFAGRLRRLARSDAFAEVSVSRIRGSLRRFGWQHRFLEGDRLRFDPSSHWRWPFLAALEDGLVESPGSGRLYRSNSQRHWPRRCVTSVRRDAGGTVVEICGDRWGRLPVSGAVDQIENAIASYFVGTWEDAVEVLPGAGSGERHLVALDQNDKDVLLSLPDCPDAT
jgi:hypothetical protein